MAQVQPSGVVVRPWVAVHPGHERWQQVVVGVRSDADRREHRRLIAELDLDVEAEVLVDAERHLVGESAVTGQRYGRGNALVDQMRASDDQPAAGVQGVGKVRAHRPQHSTAGSRLKISEPKNVARRAAVGMVARRVLLIHQAVVAADRFG